MAVNNEIWMDSGAMVSMIPEGDIYLGSFDTTDAVTTNTNGTSKIRLNDKFTATFSLVENLYRGCLINFYLVADDTFVDKAIITANDATSITVPNTILPAIITNATADDYYGVINHIGAPIPAPKGSSSGNIYTAQVLSIQFKSDTATDYEDVGIIFGTLQSAGGTEDDVGIFLTTDGTYGNAGSLSGQTEDDITVNIGNSELTTAEEYIDAVIAQVNLTAGINFTATRSGDSLILTNQFGGTIARTSGCDDGGSDSTIASLDIKSTSTIELTITTEGATSTSTNPRLLSDTWIGLTDQITVPSTAIEMKQIALNSGTRNMAYQFKGAETTSNGSFSLSANNFSWLYYVLGSKTMTVGGQGAYGTSITLDDIDAAAGKFYDTGTSSFELSYAGTDKHSSFILETVSDLSPIHRVLGDVICPPWNPSSGTTNIKSLSSNTSNKIVYTFLEKNNSDLPSFALEYTLRKPSLSTVATDITATNGRNISDKVYTKIYPGCQVESLNMTADAGQEVKMTVNFNSKNTFTAPNNYDTANNTPDLKDWVNFGSMSGGSSLLNEEQLRPFFFSDGTIEMFGQEYIRIENMTLDISNSLQPKRFIGRYDKNSQTHVPGQRVYNLSFTGLVTDNLLFEELRNNAATSLSGTDGNQIKINFKKTGANYDEDLTMVFKDYMVTSADFPLTNDKGPITVNWAIQPLELHSCTHTTNWVIQG